MKAKKNPKHDLRRNSTLYFLIGLTAVLCMGYTVIEWKSYDTEQVYDDILEKPDYLIAELPPVIQPPEPPKPQLIPPVIEVVPDISDEPESVIDIPEVDQTTEVVPIKHVKFEELPVEEEVSFIVVEDKPIFPGCENAPDKYKCFQKMMLKHIRKNFNYPEAAIYMRQQGKVYVQFTIGKDGDIDNIGLRGPHKILEDEAARIISKLPTMIPGKQRGTPVKVPFSIPINFVLQ